MSRKKATGWMDHLAESMMPNDGFTWTDGSNYGLDGFHHEQTMGEGVKNHGDLSGLSGDAVPAQTKGLSRLPDGFVADAPDDILSGLTFDSMMLDEDGLDLGGMLSEGDITTPTEKEAAALADLGWLDPTQEQDPARLPKELLPDQPPLNSIPELEEAWGVNRRTTGLDLVPNKDKEVADFEQSIQGGSASERSKTAAEIGTAVRRAIRRSHYGHDLKAIGQELAETLGHDAHRAKGAFRLIAEEHGLVGTVFVRAAAFPGLRNGRWLDKLKKHARTAQYVITDDQGVADKLKLTQVASPAEINWKWATSHYGTRLAAAGYDIPKKPTQDHIRLAFLTGPAEVEHVPAPKPVDVRPADRVTTEAAVASVVATAAQEQLRVVQDTEAPARRNALLQVARWTKAGYLTRDDALRLKNTDAPPRALLRAAVAVVQANGHKEAVYEGLGTTLPKVKVISAEAAWAGLDKAASERQVERQAEQAAFKKKAGAQVTRWVKAGLLTMVEVQKIAAKARNSGDVFRLASAVVQRRMAAETQGVHEGVKTETYKGNVRKAAPQQIVPMPKLSAQEKRLRAAAQGSGIKPVEFHKLIRWARQRMSEGVAGDTFDALLQARFSGPLLKAGASLLKAVRKDHEGLAGHLYVDAEAYASPSGTEGCDQGALRHRANGLKVVLAMPRCSGCVFANDDGICQKYNKRLASSPPVENPKAFQKEALRLANADDSEMTAALFNPAEFNLGNENLDEIGLESAPAGDLGEVLFGGLVL